jgi:hypothetical protein
MSRTDDFMSTCRSRDFVTARALAKSMTELKSMYRLDTVSCEWFSAGHSSRLDGPTQLIGGDFAKAAIGLYRALRECACGQAQCISFWRPDWMANGVYPRVRRSPAQRKQMRSVSHLHTTATKKYPDTQASQGRKEDKRGQHRRDTRLSPRAKRPRRESDASQEAQPKRRRPSGQPTRDRRQEQTDGKYVSSDLYPGGIHGKAGVHFHQQQQPPANQHKMWNQRGYTRGQEPVAQDWGMAQHKAQMYRQASNLASVGNIDMETWQKQQSQLEQVVHYDNDQGDGRMYFGGQPAYY